MSMPGPGAVVLDASSVLAFVRRERGYEHVRDVIERSRISVVNWAEVMDVALRESLNLPAIRALRATGLAIEPLTVLHAELAAGIRFNVRSTGVSLADCCSLALAHDLQLPVLTADHDWLDLALDIEVRLLR
jgi:PIN domain nuclease of toxin-antitoxin system